MSITTVDHHAGRPESSLARPAAVPPIAGLDDGASAEQQQPPQQDSSRQATPRHVLVGPRAFLSPSPMRVGTKILSQPESFAAGRELRDAAKAGDCAGCTALLKGGCGADAADATYANTPLMWAAIHGHTEVVTLLLPAGANAEGTNSDGWTALLATVWYGHTECLKALLAGGASVDVTTREGASPLLVAAMRGYRPILRLLLAAGADPEVRDCSGMTPLLIACEYGQSTIVDELLQRNFGTVSAAAVTCPLLVLVHTLHTLCFTRTRRSR
jgi:hypothetical protein